MKYAVLILLSGFAALAQAQSAEYMIPFYCGSVVTFQSPGALVFAGNLTARPYSESRCDIKFELTPRQMNYTLRVEMASSDVYIALYLNQWKVGTPVPNNASFWLGFQGAGSVTDDQWSTSEYEQKLTIVLPAEGHLVNSTYFRTASLRVIVTPHYKVCDNNETTFQCTGRDYCVQQALQCDGNTNCGDNSDEETCSSSETTAVPPVDPTTELAPSSTVQTTETVVIVVWWWRNWYYPTTAVLGGLLVLILVLSCIFMCAQWCSRICGKRRRVQQNCDLKEAAAFNHRMETVHVDLPSCSTSLPPSYEELAVVSAVHVVPATEQHGCSNAAYH